MTIAPGAIISSVDILAIQATANAAVPLANLATDISNTTIIVQPGTSGTNPVGDNTPSMAFNNGIITMLNQVLTGGPTNPGVYIGLVNSSTGYTGYPYHVIPCLTVDANATPGSTGGVCAGNFHLTASGSHPYAAQHQGISSIITKTGEGRDSCWGFSVAVQSGSGFAPESFAEQNEIDLYATTADVYDNADPNSGNRTSLLLVNKPIAVPAWGANTAYTVPTVIHATPTGGSATCYICTTAGTSGGSAPAWPTSGTITDGTVVWTTGGSYGASFARGIWYSGNGGNTVTNTVIGSDATVDNAVLDFSQVTLRQSNGAAMRLRSNAVIDWSCDGTTSASRNLRISGYNASASAWIYQYNGFNAIEFGDDYSLMVSGACYLGGTSKADWSAKSTGYQHLGVNIGYNRQGAGDTDITYSSPGGLNFYSVNVSGNISSNPTFSIDQYGNYQAGGAQGTSAPVTVTGTTYTMASNDASLIFNTTSTCSVQLQAASNYKGRILRVKNIAAQAINSNASNVVPLTSASAGTAILAATVGKWATLQSDGTNWVVMAGN